MNEAALLVEYKMVDLRRSPHYVPIGVWVLGPGPGFDLLIRFLPGNEEQQADTDQIIPRMIEYGMRAIPEGFLEFHQESLSSYRGMRGEIVKTDEFTSLKACASFILKQIEAGEIV